MMVSKYLNSSMWLILGIVKPMSIAVDSRAKKENSNQQRNDEPAVYEH